MSDVNHFINAQDAIVGMLHDYLAEKEDAKRYQEENARLKASLEKSDALVVKMSDKISSLNAQIERLTNAGDEMAAVITQYRCSPWGHKVPNAFTVWDAWFVAKKGGQPNE